MLRQRGDSIYRVVPLQEVIQRGIVLGKTQWKSFAMMGDELRTSSARQRSFS